MSYENYKNYATFQMSQYIHNTDTKTQRYWLHYTKLMKENKSHDEVVLALADLVKDLLENQLDIVKFDYPCPWLGMIHAGLSEVDFKEIAEELLTTLEENTNGRYQNE